MDYVGNLVYQAHYFFLKDFCSIGEIPDITEAKDGERLASKFFTEVQSTTLTSYHLANNLSSSFSIVKH